MTKCIVCNKENPHELCGECWDSAAYKRGYAQGFMIGQERMRKQALKITKQHSCKYCDGVCLECQELVEAIRQLSLIELEGK